jgi:hypothetical protein
MTVHVSQKEYNVMTEVLTKQGLTERIVELYMTERMQELTKIELSINDLHTLIDLGSVKESSKTAIDDLKAELRVKTIKYDNELITIANLEKILHILLGLPPKSPRSPRTQQSLTVDDRRRVESALLELEACKRPSLTDSPNRLLRGSSEKVLSKGTTSLKGSGERSLRGSSERTLSLKKLFG